MCRRREQLDEEIWAAYPAVDPNDEEGYAVIVRDDARIFVAGISNRTPAFFSVSGDVWIAELGL